MSYLNQLQVKRPSQKLLSNVSGNKKLHLQKDSLLPPIKFASVRTGVKLLAVYQHTRHYIIHLNTSANRPLILLKNV